MASAPFSTATLAQSQLPAGASSSGTRRGIAAGARFGSACRTLLSAYRITEGVFTEVSMNFVLHRDGNTVNLRFVGTDREAGE